MKKRLRTSLTACCTLAGLSVVLVVSSAASKDSSGALSLSQMQDIMGRVCECVEEPRDACMQDDQCNQCSEADGVEPGVCSSPQKKFKQEPLMYWDYIGFETGFKANPGDEVPCYDVHECGSRLHMNARCMDGECDNTVPDAMGWQCRKCVMGSKIFGPVTETNWECIDCGH